MSEPLTEAGRRLLQAHCHFDTCAGMRGPNECDCGLASGIVAIEAAARAGAGPETECVCSHDQTWHAKQGCRVCTCREFEAVDCGDAVRAALAARAGAGLDALATELDKHWLAQRVESGVAYCTCGEWQFDARSGQHPLPAMGERFLPFSQHVAAALRAASPTSEEE